MNYDYFEDSSLKLNIEKTSNDTYLKTSKLKSPLIEDYDVLENSIELSLNSKIRQSILTLLFMRI